MRSIKVQYILTCAKITGISIVALIVMSISTAILYIHSSNIRTLQLPYTLELNALSHSVSESLDALNNFVLIGNPENETLRREIWSEKIHPSLQLIRDNIALSGTANERRKLDELSQKLNELNTSQWWVEDVSRYIGNQPSLVIYQRDLLPVYGQIQSALIGVQSSSRAGEPTDELKLAVSNTHLLLTETIHHISEVILTGEEGHLNRFRLGSEQVAGQIAELKRMRNSDPDVSRLINWIELRYQHYVRLANNVTETRQASDWNQALYIISEETEILTKQVKQILLEIQSTHIRNLESDAEWAESATLGSFYLALILLLVTMTTAIVLTGGNARRMVRQIVQLKHAAKDLAQGKQKMIEIVYDDELGELAKVFNQMQKIILRRRKKFIRERERLNEVIRIVTHDIKSPLINIGGHAGIMYDKLSQAAKDPAGLEGKLPDIEACLHHVKLATGRIDELVNGILEFSKTVHSPVNLVKTPFKSIVEALLELNSSRLKDAQVSLSNLPEEIIGDEFATKFIVSTLLDNAIKYQEHSRPLILEISYKEDVKDELCCLSIKDNGQGIEPSKQGTVFKMFGQGDAQQEGFGIGLPCARSIAERLNGDIYFKNNDDQAGVTFFVEWQYLEKVPD